ncbi:D(2) dopamine receptor B-like, partial [Littorina saxatilis]|uniref:D(2) dopamine receptor B-like n=1 Tax=Littorina saxatilis TaxID=31220 RepID=UPI0038B63D55
RVIGYLCTMSCVGSLMSLSIMSLNRYVLICHHALYRVVFTARKCGLYCVLVYLFGFFLISFNFYGIGDHSFDYRSYECVWDRMASHDFTIVFSIVLVWVPMGVTGLAYGRTYCYVHKVRSAVTKNQGVRGARAAPKRSTREFTAVSVAQEAVRRNDDEKQSILTVTTVGDEGDASGSSEENPQHGTTSLSQESGPTRLPIPEEETNEGKKDNNGSKSLQVPTKYRPAKSRPSVRFPASATEAQNPEKEQQQTSNTDHPGLKLARPLFIIYVVFSTCWIPYSLAIIFDKHNSFPHELHAFITAFAHLNSSVNWLVYYHTHSKMRRAFRGLLGCHSRRSSAVDPVTTAMTMNAT